MSEYEIFVEAIEIDDPQQRADYLDRICAGNQTLRENIETLIAAHERTGEFLNRPALQQMNDAKPNRDASMPGTQVHDSGEQAEIILSFLQPSSNPDALGRLMHYEICSIAGRGGCGMVLKAMDEKLNRVVAIKIMLPHLAATSPARKRFLREAGASASIRHENVVRIYAVEEHPIPFIVMEFIEGETLQQLLDRTGPLDPPEVLKIGIQVAAGIAAAHAKKVIHRDIKPANVLIESGTHCVKITDFGLARTADDASLSHSGLILGTPLYMSPEQAQGNKIDVRTDLFSLGSVLYVLCSGRPPFRAETGIAVLKRVIEDQPRPLREIIPEVPAWLEDIIKRLLAKNPKERFESAQKVGELLSNCQMELKEHGQVILPPARRNWASVVVVFLLLFAGLGLMEVTGVTDVQSTVIRFFRPEGTLVVEVDDPEVSVSIDGEAIVITGTGAKEIRLKPGQYKVLAQKNGEVVREEIATVTTNGRRVVEIHREPAPKRLPEAPLTSGKKPEPPTKKPNPPEQISSLPKPSPELLALKRDQISPEALAYAGLGDPKKAPASLVAVLGIPEPIHTAYVLTLAYSPDGRWLASGGVERKILLHDAKTGKVHRVFEGHQSDIRYVAFSPDSTTLISGSSDGVVKLWSLEEKQEPTALKFDIPGMRLAVSPDGRFLAAGGVGGTVKLWKWGLWDSPVELPDELNRNLGAIAISSDGELLACARLDKKQESHITLYSTADGRLQKTLSGSTKSVFLLAFSPDRKHLAATAAFSPTTPHHTRLWEVSSGKEVGTSHPGVICFSRDSQKLIILSDWYPFVYDVANRTTSPRIGSIWYHHGFVCVAVSPDDQCFAIGDRTGSINIYEMSTLEQSPAFVQFGHNSSIIALAVSPDGRTVLSRGLDHTLHRFDITNRHQVVRTRSGGNPIAFSPEGDTYAVCEGRVYVWDAASGKERFSLQFNGNTVPNKLVYSPDGKLLAGEGMWDRIIRLWDVRLGKEILQFPPLKVRGNQLAFSPNGQLLAAAGVDGNLVVWNVKTGEEIAAWSTVGTGCLAFHPDGKLLVTGHADGMFRFWKTSTWTNTREFKAHSGWIHQLRYTPDGKTLLSCGPDAIIHVRNANQIAPRAVIPVGPVSINRVMFDLDASGQFLFATGPTPLIYVHRLPLED